MCVKTDFVLTWCSMLHSLYFDMDFDYILEKNMFWHFDLSREPGVCLWAKYSPLCYFMRHFL